MLSSGEQMSPSYPHDFGGLVRQLRDARGWTQEKLAREADITVTSVSNVERGATKPSAETVEKIAAAFGLRPSELDPRRLARLVAEHAISFTRRRAITRLLLDIGEREVEAVIAFLDERSKHGRRPT
ncbi:MAG TPA: helix-turn-helix domain-containing protein [Thermoanaerobaculia bacterium]|nr:helix-turn-helix domain-containing protein [Thermoanaerobaculia bacterium]